jgi:hypothetical protein
VENVVEKFGKNEEERKTGGFADVDEEFISLIEGENNPDLASKYNIYTFVYFVLLINIFIYFFFVFIYFLFFFFQTQK